MPTVPQALDSRPFAYGHWGLGGHLGVRVALDRIEIDAAATLEQRSQRYSYEDSSWLGDWDGEPNVVEDSARIGMDCTAIQLALDVGFN